MFSLLLAAALQTVVVHAPEADLTLEVARTEAQREHGLMDRTVIAPHTGMIFVFDSDQLLAFWMKDTLVPLDMIFLSPDGEVRQIYPNVNVVPSDMPNEQIPREAGYGKYVIELASGEAVKDGIEIGTKLDLRGVPPPTN
jgi:uncharacterized protein